MKPEISAGGVVYKKEGQSILIFVGKHSGHHRWVLPKGWIEPGESKDQAAVREVKEEAGVDGKLEKYLGEITIFYTSPEKERVKKTSHYFLMKHISGDPSKDLGWEMEDFAWLSPEEAAKKLDYPGEKEMVEKAAQLLSS